MTSIKGIASGHGPLSLWPKMSRQPLVNINPSDANCLLQLLLQLLPPFSYVCSQHRDDRSRKGRCGRKRSCVCMQILLHLQLLLMLLLLMLLLLQRQTITQTLLQLLLMLWMLLLLLVVVRAKWQLLWRLMIITRRPLLRSIST